MRQIAERDCRIYREINQELMFKNQTSNKLPHLKKIKTLIRLYTLYKYIFQLLKRYQKKTPLFYLRGFELRNCHQKCEMKWL